MIKRTQKDESGAETIEFTVGLFILMILLLALIQFGLNSYERITIESQIKEAAWSVDAAELSAASDRNQYFEDIIVSHAPGIDPDRLKVSNTQVSYEYPYGSDGKDEMISGATSTDSGKELNISMLHHEKTNALIEADITYSFSSLLPFWQDSESTRHLSHVQVVDERMEVR